MNDFKWLALILALAIASLIYIRLLGGAGEEGGA